MSRSFDAVASRLYELSERNVQLQILCARDRPAVSWLDRGEAAMAASQAASERAEELARQASVLDATPTR